MIGETAQQILDAASGTGLFAQVGESLPRGITGTTLAIGAQRARLTPQDAGYSLYGATVTSQVYILDLARQSSRAQVETLTEAFLSALGPEYRLEAWQVYEVTMGRDSVLVSDLELVRETTLTT